MFNRLMNFLAPVTKRFLSLLGLCFVFCPIYGFSQELPPLALKLEKVFEAKEPNWKIERPYMQMSPPVMHLKSAQGDVLIYFFIQPSESDAKSVFEGNLIAFGNTLGNRKKEVKLPNFGDDNRLLSDQSGRFGNFFFRKGKIYISVMAPTEVISKKFGHYVMEQLLVDDSEKKNND